MLVRVQADRVQVENKCTISYPAKQANEKPCPFLLFKHESVLNQVSRSFL